MKITALCLCSLIVMSTQSLAAAESDSRNAQVPSEMPHATASASRSADIPVSAPTMLSFELTVCTHETPKVACALTAPGGLVAGAEPDNPSSISRSLDIREDQQIVFVSYEPRSGFENLLYFTLLKTSSDGRSARVSAASMSNRPGKKITLTIKVLVATKINP